MKKYKNIKPNVRLYYPQKRVVKISGKYYFLPFPYMVFANTSSNLEVGFTNSLCKNTCLMPLPHFVRNNVCLYNEYEEDIDVNDFNFDDKIKLFWQKEFNILDFQDIRCSSLLKNSFISYDNWQKMTLKEVQKLVNSIMKSNNGRNKFSYSLKSFCIGMSE